MFTKELRKATGSLVIYVHPSAWNTTALTGGIFVKFRTGDFYWTLSRKFKKTQLKWGKKLKALYMETYVRMCNWSFERVTLGGTSWGRRNIWRSKHNDRTWLTRNLPSEQSTPLLG